MIFDVFGRTIEVVRRENRWVAFYPSNEGKKRPADGIEIPSHIPESELRIYLSDLCHEWASVKHSSVNLIE